MSLVDPRLVAAMREQLSRRPAGAARVGWKYGSGEEELRPGDRVITGLIVNTPVAPGDEVVAELSELGRVGLRIA